ncbi:MAG: protein translocase subunit SecF [Vicinamibacterales bacterium]
MQIFHNTSFDFLRWRWHAIALSWVVILAGLGVIATKGLPLGIEFAGGTSLIAQFDAAPSIESVRAALDKNFPGGGQNVVVQTYGDLAQRQVMVRVPQVGAESGGELGATAKVAEEALRKGGLGQFKVVGTEIVGPSVGKDLTQQGLYAFIASLVGILLYIAFRFQWSFALGAVVASIHDILVAVAFLAFFQYDITLNVIAAILTVTGYSTNDTIVIFDRVRENMRSNRREPLTKVVNMALNQTLGRTVITAGTAFLSAVALLAFGGEVLSGFAFTMVVGIVTGTYSSLYVAAAIVTLWQGRKPTAATAADEAAPAKARRGKSVRKASA